MSTEITYNDQLASAGSTLWLVNLTPHSIVIHPFDGGEPIALPPTGTVARVSVVRKPMNRLYQTVTYEGLEGLPEPVDGVVYVVSNMVREATPLRRDIASPGELIRDADGQPIGCKGLVVNR